MHLEINGRPVEFVNVKEMNLGELRELKRVAEMSPVAVEQLRWHADPDAWRGLIWVACYRAGVDVTLEQLDELNLHDMVDQILSEEKAAEEDAADSPPAEAAGAADDEEERPVTESDSDKD